MTKVLIWPRPTEQPANHGIGRVVHAQYKHLPRYGVELVEDEASADVVAIHAGRNPYTRVDVLHAHGLYWLGDKGSGVYTQWHSDANRGIVDMARRARIITVPSEWVAMPFKRDMRLSPRVIGHGVDLTEWTPGENAGYVLWNKNRPSDVCDPTPTFDLAHRGVKVVTTFAPENGLAHPGTLTVIGEQPHARMREYVRNADVYLATVKETFGIGTLEALACGVPVLGYAHGGTADIVRHERDGYLVKPGDVEGLMKGLAFIRQHRRALSVSARERASEFTWERVAEQYARVYAECAHQAAHELNGVSVIIVSYNYGRYLAQCIESILAQSYRPQEIVVVDDGSTDETARIAMRYKAQGVAYIHQNNQGVAYARNRGIASTVQPFVVCIDADDQLHPRYLEVCRAELLRDRAHGVTYTGLLVINDKDRIGQRTGWPPEFDWEGQTVVHNPPSNCIPSAAMFRRAMWERAGGYKQEHKPAEDTEFWTRALATGFTAKRVTDNPWFIYRSHPGSASRTNAYKPIDDYLPWMRDKDYPLSAPAREATRPRSYSTPKVSVIIPVGPGHAKYLPQALDSLLGQTMREWQAVVVNDSGEDLPLKAYPFARVIDIGERRGVGDARNEGVNFSDAPLVFFLDADDYLHPQALAKLCKAYAKAGGRYVYGDWVAVEDGEQRAMESPAYDPRAWVDFSHMEGKHIVSVLMATEDARRIEFDTTLPFWEDWDFFAHCSVAGIHGLRVPEQTVMVRRNTGVRTQAAFADDGKRGKVLQTLADRYREYTKGTKPMAECCGGNGEALLAARAAWDGTPPDTGGLSLQITTRHGKLNGDNNMIVSQGAPDANGGVTPVRLQFIGERQGGVTYHGKENRHYVGGNNAIERYANVHPDDVAKLVSTGDWKEVAVSVMSEVGWEHPERTPVPEYTGPVSESVTPVVAPSDEYPPPAEPEEVVEELKPLVVGEGEVVKRKRVRRKEKDTELLDLPEQ